MVNDVIEFLDGVQIRIQSGESEVEQSKYYSGHLKDTCCNNVFLFGPDGILYFASFNAPGSWHDSMVAAWLIDEAANFLGAFKICVDKGFPMSGRVFDKFVGPLSTKRLNQIARNLRAHIQMMSHIYTSLRQGSEWGMRALQGSFARLTSRMTSCKETRATIIEAFFLLHNFRTTHVGINQIATVFNPEYEQYINLYGYDKISRYYAQDLNMD